MDNHMKTASTTSQSLRVLLLALVGLFFYALVLGLLGLLGGMLISRVAHAQPSGDIDSSFTGSWFDPAQGGQGLMLEVLPDNRMFALWFAFDATGKQAWFGGVGTYSGKTATITAVLPSGGRWIPNFDESAIVSKTWGTLTFTFTDHDHGRVDFDSVLGYGTGGMDLLRLTNVATPVGADTPIGSPGAVVADASGNVYFSSSPDRIFKVDAHGTLSRVAGSGAPGYSGDGGPATDARFYFPLSYLELVQDPVDYSELVGGLALDAAHNLYVADAYNNRVRKIDSNGIVTTVLGNGFRANSGDGGPAALAPIYWPQGVAVDKTGNLLVTSVYGPLRKVAPNGIVSTIVGTICGAGYLGKGLCAPEEIAVDASGNVFAPDGYCRVREVRADGSVFTVAGDDRDPSGGLAFTCGYSGDGGPATKAAMSVPYSVAVDANNNLYIADTGNHCIRKVTGSIISTFAGSCTHPGLAGDGGAARDSLLNSPHGVAAGADGSIYVADTGNNRIRRISANGVITTIAGNGGALESAPHGTIGPAISGNWFDPTQSGHGLMLEVLSDNRLLAYWFSFDPAGDAQSWFGGIGTYSGDTATIPNVVLPTGGKWIPDFDSKSIVQNAWGTLTFTFDSCNSGRVDFSSTFGYGTGGMNLTRLTLPGGLTCP
jgi:sugar lactone lactonase YvrE